jgi:hypothetical protein
VLAEALAVGDGPFAARRCSGLHHRRRQDSRRAQKHYLHNRRPSARLEPAKCG